MLDPGFGEEQTAVFEVAKAFGINRLGPCTRKWEETGIFPVEVLNEAADLGLAAIYTGEELGGSGQTRLDAALIFEGLAMGCPSIATFLSIHNMCVWMIDAFASSALRSVWIPKLAHMEATVSYCLTEPGSGSGKAHLLTTAVRDGDTLLLNGSKTLISGTDSSDLFIVICWTTKEGSPGISAVLVEKNRLGLRFETRPGNRLNAESNTMVRFDNCRVPIGNLLGIEGEGFKYVTQGLNGERLNIAACALGAAQTALDKTLACVAEHKSTGKKHDQFNDVQFRLADMEITLQAARIFLRYAASKLDQRTLDAPKFCLMANCFVTDAALDVANAAAQIQRDQGHLTGHLTEKILHDLRAHQILEGPDEIVRLILA